MTFFKNKKKITENVFENVKKKNNDDDKISHRLSFLFSFSKETTLHTHTQDWLSLSLLAQAHLIITEQQPI